MKACMGTKTHRTCVSLFFSEKLLRKRHSCQTRIFLAHLFSSLPWLSRVTRWFLVLRCAMPRLPRSPLLDVPQHVIQRRHNRQPVFLHQDDYRVYLHCLHAAATVSACAMHAYALMTNHVHLLLTPERADSAPLTLKPWGQRYVHRIGFFIYQVSRSPHSSKGQ